MKIERVTASHFKPGALGVRLRAGDIDAVIVDGAKGNQIRRAALTVLPPPAGAMSRWWVVVGSGDTLVYPSLDMAREVAPDYDSGVIYEAVLVPVREVEPLDGDVEWATRASAKSFCAAWEDDEPQEAEP